MTTGKTLNRSGTPGLELKNYGIWYSGKKRNFLNVQQDVPHDHGMVLTLGS